MRDEPGRLSQSSTSKKNSTCELNVSRRLGDGRLPGPRGAVEPEKTFTLLIMRPTFELLEKIAPRSLHALLPIPVMVPGRHSVMHPVQKEGTSPDLPI